MSRTRCSRQTNLGRLARDSGPQTPISPPMAQEQPSGPQIPISPPDPPVPDPPPSRPPPLSTDFPSHQQLYRRTVERHDQELNLVDEIDASLFETTTPHDIFLVRNGQNDELFPFNASAFLRWFDLHATHPLTREDLSYLADRIDFKKRCLRDLPVRLFAEVTPAFLADLLHRWDQWMSSLPRALSSDDERFFLECQAYLNEATLEEHHWIHPALTLEQTRSLLGPLPPGSWLLRRSSQHTQILKNASILVLAFKTPLQVKQCRLLHVQAVGWFVVDPPTPLTSLRALQAYVGPKPRYLNICELLYRQVPHNLEWHRCVKAPSA